MTTVSHRRPLHVTVLGGGPAAAELLLALRALAADRVTLELITPDRRMPLRPASTGALFDETTMAVYDLPTLAADVGCRLRLDVAEAVAPRARRVRLATGASASYDALVVAVGARARVGVAGATTFRDQRDAELVRALLDDLGSDDLHSVAFAAPAGVAWTLPLYELALATADQVARRRLDVEIALVTGERRALELFGAPSSQRIEELLRDREVRLLTGTPAQNVSRGRLNLFDGRRLRADRVVAVPRLVGPGLSGIPTDWNAFVPTDRWGRVEGLSGVFAAGDVTAFPIKQGGLATQQADVIASVLAARAGVEIEIPPVRYALRTRLLGADRPTYLRAEVDGNGRPLPGAGELVSDEPPWWPAAKLFGRHLSPWMARQAAAGRLAA